MTDLVKIEGKEYGLEESKAKQISDMFNPMLIKMEELECEYNEILKLGITDETCAKAKELRLKLVKVRTGTAQIHKEQKQFYLQAGRFIDGWKNTQLMASHGLEENLKNIEDYFINIEKEKAAKRQELRIKELEKYGVEHIPGALGAMDETVYANYIAGVKLNYESMIEAERKAEADRIEAERKKELEQKRLNQTSRLIDYIDDFENIVFADLSDGEYENLCNDAISKRTRYETEQEEIRKENERLKQEAIEKGKEAEKERVRLQEIANKERIEAEKQREILVEKAKKEAIERAKIEAELQAEKDKEERRIQKEKEAEKAAEELELSKGDKEKYDDFLNELKAITKKYSFDSEKYKRAYKESIEAISWILS